MRLAAGTAIAGGRYTLVEHLGSGGMASVWLAEDERLGRQVAIKVMADLLADDERWLARFRREAKAAASLSHPDIVKVFDFGVEDARPYLIMAHIPGGTLKARLDDEHAPPLDAETLARELLGALAHVHAAEILHRDVKPANILLDLEGRTHLTDFGIARPQDATAMTQTGMVLGTIRYLAPEVAAGEPATEASDLYAAGRVLREVAGERPVRLAELIEALTQDEAERRPASAVAALRALDGETAAETGTTRVLGEPIAKREGATRGGAADALGRSAGGARQAPGRSRERAAAAGARPVGRACPALAVVRSRGRTRRDPARGDPRRGARVRRGRGAAPRAHRAARLGPARRAAPRARSRDRPRGRQEPLTTKAGHPGG